jgi:cytochrome P450 family 9
MLNYCLTLVQKLRISVMPTKVTKFFRLLVLDTMATREREGIVRPDMLQLLMQAKKGTLDEDNSSGTNKMSKFFSSIVFTNKHT